MADQGKCQWQARRSPLSGVGGEAFWLTLAERRRHRCVGPENDSACGGRPPACAAPAGETPPRQVGLLLLKKMVAAASSRPAWLHPPPPAMKASRSVSARLVETPETGDLTASASAAVVAESATPLAAATRALEAGCPGRHARALVANCRQSNSNLPRWLCDIWRATLPALPSLFCALGQPI